MSVTDERTAPGGLRILLCGCNGTGKSTLGKALSRVLSCRFMDVEDYYFPKTNPSYCYETPRSQVEVVRLLRRDMHRWPQWVFASVKGNLDDEITSLFTCAVHLSVPKEVRMERVRARSFARFGDRMLPGGDVYEQEKAFLDMVERRSETEVVQWLDSLNIPKITIDGTQPVETSVSAIAAALQELQLLP